MFSIVLILVFVNVVFATLADITDVKNLAGEPDYRKVRLHWESGITPTNGFQVRYCEVQSWGAQRCRTKKIDEPEENKIDYEDDIKSFSANIDGLRMATSYSFEVRTVKESPGREDRADGDDKNQNLIVIPTKGFSARATQCLPHASEIEVSTGPYFGGRIAVEAADGDRCALDGEATSPRDTYTLRINHSECGSRVNDTTVETFVLVQENLPILTHSTRRFLVLCSYQPETLTVRAGLNLPTHRGHGHASITYDDEHNYSRKSRNMRTARVLEKPEALVGEDGKPPGENESNSSLPVALIAVLMVAGVSGLVAVALRWNIRNASRDLDNVSISSESSVTSNITTADAEAGVDDTSSNSAQIYHA